MKNEIFMLAVLLLAGCSTEPVSISSSPPHAAVTVDGLVVGSTPLVVNFTPNQTYLVRVEKAGYMPAQTYSVPIKVRKASPVVPLIVGAAAGVLLNPVAGVAAATMEPCVTRHAPIEFRLQPLTNTEQIGLKPNANQTNTDNSNKP